MNPNFRLRALQKNKVYSWRLILICALCLTGGVIQSQTAPLQMNTRQLEQAAMAAYAKQNYAEFLRNMQAAFTLTPNHPRIIYNLASAYALNHQAEDALKLLHRLVAMRLYYPVERDEDFASLKESSEFQQIALQLNDNNAPFGFAEIFLTINKKGLIAEGLAYDNLSRSLFVGSVRERKIFRINKSGQLREFSAPGDQLWAVMGLKIDERRRLLWVCTSAIPQMKDFKKEEDGMAGVFQYDLQTGKLLRRYILTAQETKHVIGDLTIEPKSGDVYLTDSFSPVIYKIARGSNALNKFITDSSFSSLQGLTFDENGTTLFVADYAQGLFAIDLRTIKIETLRPSSEMTLNGIDGLYLYRGDLIGVQNGVSPQRVIKLSLTPDRRSVASFKVLAANQSSFDDPTLGCMMENSFLFIANGQWEQFTNRGELKDEKMLRDLIILRLNMQAETIKRRIHSALRP